MTEPLELAERALSFADGEAQATVVRERSLLSRFASNIAADLEHERADHVLEPTFPDEP